MDGSTESRLDIHSDGVIKRKGHVTFKPINITDVIEDEVERSEEETQSSVRVGGVLHGQEPWDNLGGVWSEVFTQLQSLSREGHGREHPA